MGEKKYLSENRRARFDYTIEETYEAGIVLQGSEVKSCRSGKVNLKDSYCRFKEGEIYLVDSHISYYPFSPDRDYEPYRHRKLLLHSREIKRLMGKINEKGLSLIPLSMYLRRGKIKVELGLGKGKKLYDRREELKKRVHVREMERGRKGLDGGSEPKSRIPRSCRLVKQVG